MRPRLRPQNLITNLTSPLRYPGGTRHIWKINRPKYSHPRELGEMMTLPYASRLCQMETCLKKINLEKGRQLILNGRMPFKFRKSCWFFFILQNRPFQWNYTFFGGLFLGIFFIYFSLDIHPWCSILYTFICT